MYQWWLQSCRLLAADIIDTNNQRFQLCDIPDCRAVNWIIVKRPLEGGLTRGSVMWLIWRGQLSVLSMGNYLQDKSTRSISRAMYPHICDVTSKIQRLYAACLFDRANAKRVLSKQLLHSKIGVLWVGTLWGKWLRTLSYYNYLFSQLYSFIYLFIFFEHNIYIMWG